MTPLPRHQTNYTSQQVGHEERCYIKHGVVLSVVVTLCNDRQLCSANVYIIQAINVGKLRDSVRERYILFVLQMDTYTL